MPDRIDPVNWALDKATSRFGEIDVNRDNRLSLVEIQNFAKRHPDEGSQEIARALEDNFASISDMHPFTRKLENHDITREKLDMAERLREEPDGVGELMTMEPTDTKKVVADALIGLGAALLTVGAIVSPGLAKAKQLEAIASVGAVGLAGYMGGGIGALVGANVDKNASLNYYNLKLGDAQRMKL